MLKTGLVGLGFMGRGHLDNLIRLTQEGYPVRLTAVCDIDEEKFSGKTIAGNLQIGLKEYDFSQYALYTDFDEMLQKEELDCVIIALPTYLHKETTIKALKRGINVLCEKPMALSSADCEEMISTAEESGRKLMIGQCLRFWPAYEYLKHCVDTGKFGKAVGGYFFRGGGTPQWSYQGWMMKKDLCGGCLMDQHIHDIDMINWLFGKPLYVSTLGKNVIPGSGYDIVSTNYYYDDGKVINAQDDWTLNGDFGYEMLFRVNFERGNLEFKNGRLKVNPNDGKSYTPDLSAEDGYYRELIYFLDAVMNDKPILISTPESTADTIRIAEAEARSADKGGEKEAVL
ncbi:MAG TPA: Gfo/Idh/MocA family oxidoreductase [Candidatus Atribacteria bacterium]|nr:Gfo/Idh/MocA family oxidoreductase [Candidatus Atribacteria bacterium]